MTKAKAPKKEKRPDEEEKPRMEAPNFEAYQESVAKVQEQIDKLQKENADGPLRPPYPCMGMIFGTRAGPRVMSSNLSDDFRKMGPCKGRVQFEINLK